MATDNIPVYTRLTPRTYELLRRAAKEQRRSMASVVEELITENLGKYAAVNDRIDRWLGSK